MISQSQNSESRSSFKLQWRRYLLSLLSLGLVWSAQSCLGGSRVLAFGSGLGATNVPPQATNAITLAPGTYQDAIVRADGAGVRWGPETLVLRTNLLAIALGYYDSYWRLDPDGRVFVGTWGTTGSYSGASNVVAITTYPYTVLHEDGTVAVGGTNNPAFSNIVAVASTGGGAKPILLALRSDGTVATWNDSLPIPADLSDVVAVATGFIRMALRRNGTVTVWGNAAATNVFSVLSNVVAISCGDQALALKQDGTVFCWGGRAETQVPPTLSNVVAIAAGPDSMVIVDPSPPPLAIVGAGVTNGFFQVTVPTISGRVYCLEYATSLPATNWTPLPLVAGNGRMRVLVDPTPVVATAQRFYRVRKW